jgi:hypothetical protein
MLDSEDDMEGTDDSKNDAMDDDNERSTGRDDEDDVLSTPRAKRTRIGV